MLHTLKILPKYFEAVVSGDKTFEVRKNDRNFKVHDEVRLLEWDPIECDYTGRRATRTITYILNDPNYCKEGYIIFGIK